ncbi:MAG: hypothetical protein CMJ94_06220 [Planctomycetes bacterium]|nr:hypothetical protein [Planctomycetota bacterium]
MLSLRELWAICVVATVVSVTVVLLLHAFGRGENAAVAAAVAASTSAATLSMTRESDEAKTGDEA